MDKQKIDQIAIKHTTENFLHKYSAVTSGDTESTTKVNEFGIIVDDSIRSNAIIL